MSKPSLAYAPAIEHEHNAWASGDMRPKLPVVQVHTILHGTPAFEARKARLIECFSAKVPEELRLPSDLIQDPPANVTKIPHLCGILSPEEVEITEGHDAVSLLEAIRSHRYTAVAVARAFCKRAIIAHQLTCCLTQWYMKEAIDQAMKLDEYLEKNGKPIGPLHGLPISVKDHIQVAKTSSSQGCMISISEDKKDADVVAILRNQGAIFYCKTNQPQSLMHLESDSHWGRVLNPFNIQLSAGGSTGGEAALIAMKGSVLGIGTDIGGSIRGPSAFCGIYGFKATSNTLPTIGYVKGDPPPVLLGVPISTGPMCRTMRDMELFMKCILSTKPYLSDPNVVRIPWTGSETRLHRPINVGIITNDGFIEPQPPVKRALSWAKERLLASKLATLGAIRDFSVFGAEEAWKQVHRLYWPDGGELVKNSIDSSGEPVHPLTSRIFQEAGPFGVQTVLDLPPQHKKRDDFRLSFAKRWSDQDVDIVIGPAFVGPACAHDTAFYWNYTSLYNLVDYPGVTIPTPIKTREEDHYDEDYEPLSDACLDVKKLWETADFVGAPVSLQVVARRHHDNELFAALQVLKEALGLP